MEKEAIQSEHDKPKAKESSQSQLVSGAPAHTHHTARPTTAPTAHTNASERADGAEHLDTAQASEVHMADKDGYDGQKGKVPDQGTGSTEKNVGSARSHTAVDKRTGHDAVVHVNGYTIPQSSVHRSAHNTTPDASTKPAAKADKTSKESLQKERDLEQQRQSRLGKRREILVAMGAVKTLSELLAVSTNESVRRETIRLMTHLTRVEGVIHDIRKYRDTCLLTG
ncbi:hypothetical protein, variant, partial [Sphaeroforma arctica JP610]